MSLQSGGKFGPQNQCLYPQRGVKCLCVTGSNVYRCHNSKIPILLNVYFWPKNILATLQGGEHFWPGVVLTIEQPPPPILARVL